LAASGQKKAEKTNHQRPFIWAGFGVKAVVIHKKGLLDDGQIGNSIRSVPMLVFFVHAAKFHCTNAKDSSSRQIRPASFFKGGESVLFRVSAAPYGNKGAKRTYFASAPPPL
jgi:Ribonuclease G/E